MAHLNELTAQNRNFDFYWYPRSDEAKLRTLNPPEVDFDIPYAVCVEEEVAWSDEALPKKRTLKFDEMEYAMPADAGPDCFQEVRQRVKAKHRKTVAWRVLYRTVAPDDSYLSPAHGRDTVTISLHHNAGLPFWEYFKDIEPIFRAHGGRPHWGKKHTLTAKELRPLYPQWERFAAVREQMDAPGMFLNPYLRQLLIEN
jgi:FAD/FMN-containing dehydrogenase